MTQEPQDRLKQLFAATDTELPGEHFTAEVMSELVKPRRRARLIWLSSVVGMATFLVFLLWNLEPLLGSLAVEPRVLLDVATRSWAVVSQSPLVYVYGTALAGHVLLKLVQRLELRWS
jgi:hypothetical protein